jgi:hypothetical protein
LLRAGYGRERMQQSALRSDDSDLAIRHFDAPSERTQMVPAVATADDPYSLVGRSKELPHHGWCDDVSAVAFEGSSRRPLRVGLGLIADRFEASDTVLERRVVRSATPLSMAP